MKTTEQTTNQTETKINQPARQRMIQTISQLTKQLAN